MASIAMPTRRIIKGVLFDVGGTLVHPRPSVGGVYAEVMARYGYSHSADELNQRFKHAWTAHKAKGARLVNKESWKAVVNDILTDVASTDKPTLFEAIYEAFSRPHAWAIYPDARPLLQWVKARGLKRGVASNWDERLPALLDALSLTSYFDAITISYEAGSAKPDKRFFERALERMQLPPEHVIHIGDDAIEDGEGAQAAGIQAFLIDRKGTSSQPDRLSSLREMEALLERM